MDHHKGTKDTKEENSFFFLCVLRAFVVIISFFSVTSVVKLFEDSYAKNL
jgi:hypothetical protein